MVVPSPKVVINLNGTYEKVRRTRSVQWLARSFGTSTQTHKQKSCYFSIRIYVFNYLLLFCFLYDLPIKMFIFIDKKWKKYFIVWGHFFLVPSSRIFTNHLWKDRNMIRELYYRFSGCLDFAQHRFTDILLVLYKDTYKLGLSWN